jgi:hypothetical protein
MRRSTPIVAVAVNPADQSSLPRYVALALIVLAVLFGSAACGEQAVSANPESLTRPGNVGGQYLGGTATGDTQRGADFARWVLEQDPRREFYTDVVVRGEQSLGVKVQPNVTRRELNDLLVALTEGMSRTFPGKPLTVMAFYQSGDKLAEADYNPRDGNIDVQFVQ